MSGTIDNELYTDELPGPETNPPEILPRNRTKKDIHSDEPKRSIQIPKYTTKFNKNAIFTKTRSSITFKISSTILKLQIFICYSD